MVLSLIMSRSCFGVEALLLGQNLVPFPPAIITIFIIILTYIQYFVNRFILFGY